jgi:phosphatidate cytidylyltransferase
MNHVAKRTVTALITASLAVAGLIYLPIEAVVPILILMVTLVHVEFTQIVRQRCAIMSALGVATGIAVMTAILYDMPLLLLVVGAVWARFLFCRSDNPISALGTTLLGVLYIPFMLTWLIKIPLEHGMTMLFYTVAVIKISDMGGFAFGMAFGKHKMCPSISPGKSWEGLGGSIFGSILISCLFIPWTRFSWCEAVVFGVLAALVGTFGDLVESRFKRECGVKDSATFMPAGLGGFLDMFDSLVFAPALFYLLFD